MEIKFTLEKNEEKYTHKINVSFNSQIISLDLTSESTAVLDEINNFIIDNIREDISFINNNKDDDTVDYKIAKAIVETYCKEYLDIRKSLSLDVQEKT